MNYKRKQKNLRKLYKSKQVQFLLLCNWYGGVPLSKLCNKITYQSINLIFGGTTTIAHLLFCIFMLCSTKESIVT